MKQKQQKRRQKKIKKDRKLSGEILYGPHAIIEMLRAKKRSLITIYTFKKLPKAWKRIGPHLPKRLPNIQYVDRSSLDRMAGVSDHGGVVALVAPFRYATKMFDSAKKPFVLLLDGIQDVRNLGAILRSAYSTGVDGIVMCKKGGAALTPTVFKTSAGLAEYLAIYRSPSIKAAVSELKKAGYHLYMAVVGQGATNVLDVSYASPMCLVIGSEETGITKEVLGQGELITLSQRRQDISFNASVAAGILLFILSQKKMAKNL